MDSTNNIHKSFLQTLNMIQLAMKERFVLPALILTYSTIDSASFLAASRLDERVDTRFQTWVNRWMLTAKSLPCNAEELYSARCGVVHSFTSDSTLTRKSGVRTVLYAWAPMHYSKLQRAIDIQRRTDLIAIQLEHLFEALAIGLGNFFEEATKDDILAAQFAERSAKYFSDLSSNQLGEFLKSQGE